MQKYKTKLKRYCKGETGNRKYFELKTKNVINTTF